MSRSLVDAAAEAISAAVHMPGSRGQAEQAVAAVLETLAADKRKHRFGYPLHDLRRLAAEIREG